MDPWGEGGGGPGQDVGAPGKEHVGSALDHDAVPAGLAGQGVDGAHQLAVRVEGAITGEDLDFMPQELLEQDVDKFAVYARVSPEHKAMATAVSLWSPVIITGRMPAA